jgi:hypothetical protein
MAGFSHLLHRLEQITASVGDQRSARGIEPTSILQLVFHVETKKIGCALSIVGASDFTTRGDADLCLLRQRDQFRDVVGLDFAVEDNDVRDVAGQSHRQRIVAEPGLYEGIDSQRPIGADQQGVTVGR